MAPPVNQPGPPPDVTALIVMKEIDAATALRDSREMTVMNVLMVTMATHVVSRFQLRFFQRRHLLLFEASKLTVFIELYASVQVGI